MDMSLESRLARIRFSRSAVGADRIHYVNEADVRKHCEDSTVRAEQGRITTKVFHSEL